MRVQKYFKGAVDIPILAISVLGMALLALGIGYITPTGEQSKLAYEEDLWCVSNYIEQRPVEYLKDGRPRQDKLLDGKEDWIVRDQVKADTKEQAEEIARKNGDGRFEPSDQNELREKLAANDKEFFTTHFNTGATMAGPCWGTGSSTSMTGRWLNDAIREDCFDIEAPSSPASNLASAVLTEGNCQAKSVTVNRRSGGSINTPASGVAVVEEHLVTKDENFQPTSTKDQIDRHYSVTEKAVGIKYSHQRGWTPAEGGGSIGGGSASPPPAAVEPYVVNMNWSSRPAEGTRMILTNPKTGKSVVAAAGYETGPGNTAYAIGAQEEAMQAIGAKTGDKIEFGFAVDQSLPFGPIKCEEKTAQGESGKSELASLGNILSLFAGVFSVENALAASPVIVIDPGHGSAINKRTYEGQTELAIAKNLKAILEKEGYTVVMTRTASGQVIGNAKSGIERIDLRARAAIANSANASLIISLHSDDRSNDTYDVIYPDVTRGDQDGKGVSHVENYLAKAKKSAQSIHNALKSAGFTPNGSRSLRGESNNSGRLPGIPFVLSANSKAPLVTIEVYGHDSSTLRTKYASSSTQEKVARAIANGVKNYFGQNTAEAASTQEEVPKKTSSAPSNCPEKAPNAGPSYGNDYQAQIAHSFEQQYSILNNQVGGDPQELLAGAEGGVTGNGECALPIPNNSKIVSVFGTSRGRGKHAGVDFSAPTGTPVVATMDGEIVLSEDEGFADGTGSWGSTSQNGGYGNRIKIKHANDVYSEYHHLKSGSLLPVGTQVTKGQVIALVDHNGWSSGPHLHFQLMKGASTSGAFNPVKCLGL